MTNLNLHQSTNEMLHNTIDPSSFFLNLLYFENLNNCENILGYLMENEI